eukprot:702580-Prymnesium_polylepis.1
MRPGECMHGGGVGCVPGCGNPVRWCDPKGGLIGGWCKCGFAWCSGTPQPYRPSDLGEFLALHAEHGAPYKGEGSYTGYNEVIVDGDHCSAMLPHSIEAFFVTEGGGAEWASYAAKVHRDFLRVRTWHGAARCPPTCWPIPRCLRARSLGC